MTPVPAVEIVPPIVIPLGAVAVTPPVNAVVPPDWPSVNVPVLANVVAPAIELLAAVSATL